VAPRGLGDAVVKHRLDRREPRVFPEARGRDRDRLRVAVDAHDLAIRAQALEK